MAILIQKYPKNYFGINETTNIFTGDTAPINVVDEYFRIPSVVNIEGEEWVAVNTGYVPLETQPIEDFEFEITDDNGSSLQALQLVIGTPKDPSSKPASNVVVWFNQPYVKGCYYVNSKWLGKVFHIKKGKYVSTTANAGRLNEISSNYEFVNNVELAINDTIDKNNINKKYVDGSYITETKKANGKIIYASNAVNAVNATNAQVATLADLWYGYSLAGIAKAGNFNNGETIYTASGTINAAILYNSYTLFLGYRISGSSIIYTGQTSYLAIRGLIIYSK